MSIRASQNPTTVMPARPIRKSHTRRAALPNEAAEEHHRHHDQAHGQDHPARLPVLVTEQQQAIGQLDRDSVQRGAPERRGEHRQGDGPEGEPSQVDERLGRDQLAPDEQGQRRPGRRRRRPRSACSRASPGSCRGTAGTGSSPKPTMNRPAPAKSKPCSGGCLGRSSGKRNSAIRTNATPHTPEAGVQRPPGRVERQQGADGFDHHLAAVNQRSGRCSRRTDSAPAAAAGA